MHLSVLESLSVAMFARNLPSTVESPAMPRKDITTARAIARIEKAGALLVFPIKDKPRLPSIWSSFYPDEEMDWDWSDEGDNRVATLWHLRTELSISREVVYSKWFRNRATCFSRALFTALLSLVSTKLSNDLKLSEEAERILGVLHEDSPLPTKELKARSELSGGENNAAFERAMKQLWSRFLIVGYGEVEEGGYPSLAVGSAKLLFEDEWDASREISDSERRKTLAQFYPPHSEFYRQYLKVEQALLRD